MPIGQAPELAQGQSQTPINAFTHYEVYDQKKLRKDTDIHAWPKN